MSLFITVLWLSIVLNSLLLRTVTFPSLHKMICHVSVCAQCQRSCAHQSAQKFWQQFNDKHNAHNKRDGMVAVLELFSAFFVARAVACLCMHRRSLNSRHEFFLHLENSFLCLPPQFPGIFSPSSREVLI